MSARPVLPTEYATWALAYANKRSKDVTRKARAAYTAADDGKHQQAVMLAQEALAVARGVVAALECPAAGGFDGFGEMP